MAFPANAVGMLLGGAGIALGLFQIGTAGAGNPVAIVVGLVVLIIGAIEFAL